MVNQIYVEKLPKLFLLDKENVTEELMLLGFTLKITLPLLSTVKVKQKDHQSTVQLVKKPLKNSLKSQLKPHVFTDRFLI